MITKELIERFLRNKCTPAEHQAVLEHLGHHPEEWRLFLDEEDWEQFEGFAGYNEERASKMYEVIKERTIGMRLRRRRILRRLSAAAILILVAGAWWLRGGNHPSGQAIAEKKIALLTSPGIIWRHVSNAGPVNNTLSLPDGSVVELAPNSRIDYPENAAALGRRMIYLTGKASFNVIKDKALPFTVNSGDIGTTVLGTSFTVDAYPEANETRVVLHRGRVVVRASDHPVLRLAREEYLFSGDVLIYRKNSGLALVNRAVKEEKLVKAVPHLTEGRIARPDWYQFEGQTLPEVLDQLSTYYQVTIYYYSGQLSNRYFTGRIEKTDSLNEILKDIALLHHLTIRKEKDGVYLVTTKSH